MAKIKSFLQSSESPITAHGQRPEIPAGILGGGQLARMLAQAAAPLGLDIRVFTDNEDSPAGRLGARITTGSPKDIEALRAFLTPLTLCVFESEFISTELLKIASQGLGVKFFPPLATMNTLQDKIQQKLSCDRLQIPTAPFLVHDGKTPAAKWVDEAGRHFNNSFVVKWGRMGYDGKGLFMVDGEKRLSDAVLFCENALKQKIPLYAEKRIAFKRELAIIGCYSKSGEFAAYPLVVSEQEDGICNRVYGPATAIGVNPQLEQNAREAAQKIAESNSLYGSFGIEFFETEDGALLVNEIAPRVHNTGHYTQDGCVTSQFENHWRAVLGLPLGDIQPVGGFAMQNLLGPKDVHLTRDEAALPALNERLHLHWYDKKDIVPKRKLGHINATAASANDVPALLLDLENAKNAWHQNLQAIQREKKRAE